jgi:hypothetical protein
LANRGRKCGVAAGESDRAGLAVMFEREPPRGWGNLRGLGLRGRRASTACELVVFAPGRRDDSGAPPKQETCQSKERRNHSATATQRPAGLGQPCRGPYTKCSAPLGVNVCACTSMESDVADVQRGRVRDNPRRGWPMTGHEGPNRQPIQTTTGSP